jgi:hypothetical protein
VQCSFPEAAPACFKGSQGMHGTLSIMHASSAVCSGRS